MPLRLSPPSAACALASGVAAITLAVGAAPADATIVPGQSIAGVRLGDAGARVQEVLGKAQSVQKWRDEGGQSWFWREGVRPVDWATLNTQLVVIGLETGDKQQKTSKGIGPGSSLKAVKKAYPSVSCRLGELPPAAPDTDCTLETRHGGKATPTKFVIAGGKVVLVDVGDVGEF